MTKINDLKNEENFWPYSWMPGSIDIVQLVLPISLMLIISEAKHTGQIREILFHTKAVISNRKNSLYPESKSALILLDMFF